MDERVARLLYRTAARFRGENTFSYLADLRKSQWMSAGALKRWQEERLGALMSYLRRHVPYYTALEVVRFKDLPSTNRKVLREMGRSLVNARMLPGSMAKKTSGSTGEPVTVYRDHEGLAREQAVTLRAYEWAGVRAGSRQARFWGVPINTKALWRSQLIDFALNRERFAAFNYTEADLERYYHRFQQLNPAYVYGYASLIRDFAQYLRATSRSARTKRLKAVITTAEVLTEEARALIEAAFGVKVYNEYGCSEVGTIAHECEMGRMHLNDETLFVEVADEEGRIREAGQGRILVTDLYNRVQPLVRYELGDFGTLVPGERCECGRGLSLLRDIHGRSNDTIYGPGGRRYFSEFFAYLFKEVQQGKEKIRQYQVIQNDREIVTNIIKGRDYREDLEEDFRRLMHREFGDYFQCRFNYLDSIPREKSGKLRLMKRLAPADHPPHAGLLRG